MEYIKQFEYAKSRLEQAQFRQTQELKQKQNDNVIKQKEKLDTVQRILRKREYYQEKLKEKLFRGTQKAEALKKQMDDILNLRTELRREIELNKKDIMEKFTKIKQGKVDPEVLAEFGLGNKANQLIQAIKEARSWAPQKQENNNNLNSSYKKPNPRRYYHSKDQQQMTTTLNDFQKKESSSIFPSIEQANENAQQNKPQTPLKSQKSFKQVQSQMSKTFTSGDNLNNKKISVLKTKRSKNNVVGNSQAAREFLKKYNSLGPNLTEKQAQELFQEYQTQQNTEMLRLFETEQQKQARRDTQLEKCLNPVERKKLEKQFNEEKEKAVLRVNLFVQDAKATTAEFAKKLGIIQKF